MSGTRIAPPVARKRELDTDTFLKDDGSLSEDEARLLRELNASLHELSQPMTVLLCTLEYGASLSSVEEMKQMISISQDACERLRQTVLQMQTHLKQAIADRASKARILV